MQADEKQKHAELDVNITASITLTRGYKLPLAKLTLSGCLNQSTDDSKINDVNKVIRRAIVFVIDRSYSMNGDRITMVRNALKPFVKEICDDNNTIIKLVLFNKTVETVNIPRDAVSALSIIDKRVFASGGTDFHAASIGLVQQSMDILQQYPTYQLTVIMCSDGEVGKQNAEKGHLHWKTFVNNHYLQLHKIVPFVETIGISPEHDADVLDGFIVEDAAGNYCKCTTLQQIGDALENAQNETMGRTATKLCIEFPLNVCNDIYGSDAANKFHLHDLIVTADEFKSIFWISMDEFDDSTTGGDGLHLIVNKQVIPITVKQVVNDKECQYEAIDFYNQVLKDMLHILRSITDAAELKVRAKQIENELNSDYGEIFELITSAPAEKEKLQKEIKELLRVHQDDDEKKEIDIKHRAELMKRYKTMNRIWKKHRGVVVAFQNTLSCVKTLVREIILGQVRMQEIRQHILDLHFRKKHAKRISKLVLTEDQLTKRQAVYDGIDAPAKEHCLDITDEVGTGCYLSTLSKRECVLDGDALWICGRVNRSGGAAVSNPELVKIEYISHDLVSDSYFKMALEALEGGAIADSSRELINARLFPIYANLWHYKASKPYLNEVLSHTLSGRLDIRVVDYNSLYAAVGCMISRNNLTFKSVTRILYEIIPSFELFLANTFSKPFKCDGRYNREPDSSAKNRIKLGDKNRYRLCKYIEHFAARTTAWVSKASVLFADRLMNLDIDFEADFYLSVILQRLRQVFTAQIPKKLEEDELRNKVVANHKKILQILICGLPNEKEQNDEKDDVLLPFEVEYKRAKHYKLFEIARIKAIELDVDDNKLMEQYDVNNVKLSSKQMLIDIFARIDVRDLIQGNMFFSALANMPCDIDEDKYQFDEFRSNEFAIFDKIPNDLNILLNEVNGNINVNVLRAICCVAIICHSNRLYKDNLYWFGDDKLKQIFHSPDSVLAHIYQHYVIRNIRYDYDVSVENKRIEELVDLHSNPVLPDDIDEFGDLPDLRCGWKKCGKIFDNRDKLLDHVRRCIPHIFVHKFHLNCKSVLQNKPNLSLKQFSKKALQLFDAHKRKYVTEKELSAYYHQFKQIFANQRKSKNSNNNKPQPNIVSTGNMYYFDQLVSVKKN